jgi:GTP-binding protein HflX
VDEEQELGELRELLRTAGVEPVGELVQRRPAPDPRTYVGKGKLEELKALVKSSGAESLIVDDELDPSQQRQLENALTARVIDRTQLILDIFAQHARSAEGKLQVELAQLEYNLPRMRGMWQHLERLGGGIGTRGPGESQLETDRRIARRRIGLLKRKLRELEKRRALQRKAREQSVVPVVALAGYTNAGKSTLLNALTGSDVVVANQLFATLDPTVRRIELPSGRAATISDTVGFVSKLPHELVEAFRSTLEEVARATLILHVADASSPELAQQIDAVRAVLHEIGASQVPSVLALNKADRLSEHERARILARVDGRAVAVSALNGEGLPELMERVEAAIPRFPVEVRLLVPFGREDLTAMLYREAEVLSEDAIETGTMVRARVGERALAAVREFRVDEPGRAASLA